MFFHLWYVTLHHFLVYFLFAFCTSHFVSIYLKSLLLCTKRCMYSVLLTCTFMFLFLCVCVFWVYTKSRYFYIYKKLYVYCITDLCFFVLFCVCVCVRVWGIFSQRQPFRETVMEHLFSTYPRAADLISIEEMERQESCIFNALQSLYVTQLKTKQKNKKNASTYPVLHLQYKLCQRKVIFNGAHIVVL